MTDLVKQLEELWLEKPQKMTWAEMQEVTDKAAARIAALEAALKPFALGQAATEAEHNGASDDYPLTQIVWCGDLRAARAAYLGEKE